MKGDKPLFEFALRCIEQRLAIRRFFDEQKQKPHSEYFFLKIQCDRCDRFVTVQSFEKTTYRTGYDCVHCSLHQVHTTLVPGRMKLGFRVEWAGKWMMYRIDFEPGGKDHGSAGGSLETAGGLLQKIFQTVPPMLCIYEFIQNSKTGLMHKSLQQTDTTEQFLTQLQSIGPEVLNYHLFVKKPSRHLILDLDQLESLYDEFDNAIRRFHQDPTAERALVLAFEHSAIPRQVFSSRQIAQLLQIYHSPTKVFDHLNDLNSLSEIEQRFLERRIEALNIARLSRMRASPSVQEPDLIEQTVLRRLHQLLAQESHLDPAAVDRIIQTIHLNTTQPKIRIYRSIYQALFQSKHGPPLGVILPSLGIREILHRIEQAL